MLMLAGRVGMMNKNTPPWRAPSWIDDKAIKANVEKRAALIDQAKAAAKLARHELAGFNLHGLNTATGRCRKCGLWVDVDTHPRHNEREISGPALFLTCNPSRISDATRNLRG